LRDIIAEPENAMLEDSPLRLCGKVGHKLMLDVMQGKFLNKVDMGRALFKFFVAYSGDNELWDLLDLMINSKQANSSNKILHVNDLPKAYHSRIQELETASPFSFLGTPLAKKETRMMECAKMYLKLGEVKKYCKMMISLGYWEKAISFAPYVSLPYWKKCIEKYTEELKVNGGEDLLEYQILGNDIKGAVKYLIDSEQYEDAKLISILGENNVYVDVAKDTKKREATVQSLDVNFDSISDQSKKLIVDISHSEAEQYFREGEVILGAAAELAIGDKEAAIMKLIRANELPLAYYLAKLLKVPVLDQINYFLGMKSERLGLIDQAATYYRNCKNPRLVQLFTIKHQLDSSKYFLKSSGEYVKLALGAKGVDAVFYYLMAGDIQRAAKMTIENTNRIFAEKRYDQFTQMIEMNSLMQNYSISNLPKDDKAHLLLYGSFIGLFKAMWLGFVHVMRILLIDCKNIESKYTVKLGIDYEQLEKFRDRVSKKIISFQTNMVEDLVESINDKERKTMMQEMFKAIKVMYSMGIIL